MPKGKATAIVSGRKIAEADEWEVVEGNVYFPPSSVDMSFLSKTDHSTHCPWKGDASYYTISLDKTEFKNAAVCSLSHLFSDDISDFGSEICLGVDVLGSEILILRC